MIAICALINGHKWFQKGLDFHVHAARVCYVRSIIRLLANIAWHIYYVMFTHMYINTNR